MKAARNASSSLLDSVNVNVKTVSRQLGQL